MGNRKLKLTLTIILAVLVVALIATAVVYFIGLSGTGEQEELPVETPAMLETADPQRFLEGITIAGVDVGGMTLKEARDAIAPVKNELLSNISFELVHAQADASDTPAEPEPPAEPGETAGEVKFPGTVENLGIVCNDMIVLDQAFDLGHSGEEGEELDALIKDVRTNGREFEIALEVDENVIMAGAIAEISEKINIAAQDATVQINKDAEDPAQMFVFTNAVTGVELDQQAFITLIEDTLAVGTKTGELTIPVIITEPQIMDGAATEGIVLRSHFESSFAKSPYNRDTRVFNIKKACGLISGTILEPGQVFSTNDTLGPRTYALGWKGAPAIIEGGASEDQAGGGVCHVSTTLYDAVVMADLEIVYRRGHSSKLGYDPGGLDATINTGTIDFKWKNNTDSNIYVIMYVDDEKKVVVCDIYGEAFPEEYDEIRLTSKKLRTLTPQGEIEYRVDKTQKPDYHKVFAERKNGSVYQSYKNYYKNGELVKTEKLAETTYPARNGITIVGPGYLSPSPGLTTPGTNTPNPNTPNPNTPNPNTPDPNTPNPETPNPNTPDPEPNTPDPEVPVG